MRRNDYYKECIAYITSADGIHVYVASILTSLDSTDPVSRAFDKELCRDLAYYEEGIAVYYDEMKDK